MHRNTLETGADVAASDGDAGSPDMARAFAPGAHAAIRAIVAANGGEPLPAAAQPVTVAPDSSSVPSAGLFGSFLRALTDDYANFRGRAPRREFWGFLLFAGIGLALLVALTAAGIAQSDFSSTATDVALSPLLFIGSGSVVLYVLALACPGIAVAVRRCHDAGLTGWLVCLNALPVLGTLVLLVMAALPGQAMANRYGPRPPPGRP